MTTYHRFTKKEQSACSGLRKRNNSPVVPSLAQNVASESPQSSNAKSRSALIKLRVRLIPASRKGSDRKLGDTRTAARTAARTAPPPRSPRGAGGPLDRRVGARPTGSSRNATLRRRRRLIRPHQSRSRFGVSRVRRLHVLLYKQQ